MSGTFVTDLKGDQQLWSVDLRVARVRVSPNVAPFLMLARRWSSCGIHVKFPDGPFWTRPPNAFWSDRLLRGARGHLCHDLARSQDWQRQLPQGRCLFHFPSRGSVRECVYRLRLPNHIATASALIRRPLFTAPKYGPTTCAPRVRQCRSVACSLLLSPC